MSLPKPSSLASVAVAVLASDATHVSALLGEVAVEEVAERFVMGGGDPTKAAAQAAGAIWVQNTTELVSKLASDITHVWMIHDDVRPRPDALRALVDASEQIDASLVGSKILGAADPTMLESVGGATDVYLVADLGLAHGELDQEQYDVVRDVAFVAGESLLIRRDLLKGLGGPDLLLPPLTRAIDFAGRARLAGGRVAVVPSSEVFHTGSCYSETAPWREAAAGWRAAAKVYSGWTVAWVLPLALSIAVLNALARLVMLDFRPLVDLGRATGWSLKHFTSTIRARRQARKIAQVDDGELFRYQRTGSLLLNRLGSDLSAFFRERSRRSGLASRFDEDRMFWQQPGFASLLTALALIMVGVRSILLGGLPVAGHLLPASVDPLAQLRSYAGGWNPAGFGTAGPGHPAAAATALAGLVFSEKAVLVITLSAVVLGLMGMRRLLIGLGIEGLPAVLGALVGVGGLAVQVLGEGGYWPALPAVAAAPWMLAGVLAPWPDGIRRRLARLGSVMIPAMVVASFVPFAAGSALVASVCWALFGHGPRWWAPLRAGLIGAASLAVVLPWLWWSVPSDLFSGGEPLAFAPSPWLAGGMGIGVILTLLVGSSPQATVAGVGGVVAVAGAAVTKAGPGLEPSAGGLVLMAVGLALAVGGVAAAIGSRSGVVRAVLIMSQVTVLSGLVTVGLGVVSGSWHMPEDRYSEALAVIDARSEGADVDRILFVGADLPGQGRLVDGVPYKVISIELGLAGGWLGVLGPADLELESVLRSSADPAELRTGSALGALGIRWIVATVPSLLDPAFDDKLDLKLLPVGGESFRLYENVAASTIAHTSDGVAWQMKDGRFAGEPAPEVILAVNPAPFGEVDFPVVLDGSSGEVGAGSDATMRLLGWIGAAVLVLSVVAAAARLGDRA